MKKYLKNENKLKIIIKNNFRKELLFLNFFYIKTRQRVVNNVNAVIQRHYI